MKKNWMQTVSLSLNVALIALVLIQGRALWKLEYITRSGLNTLTTDLRALEGKLYNLEESVIGRISWVEEFGLELVGVNQKAHTVQVRAAVKLQRWNKDTEVALIARVGEKTSTVTAVREEEGDFVGVLDLPAEDGEESGELFVELCTGSEIIRESVYRWSDLPLPIKRSSSSVGELSLQDGILSAGDGAFKIRIQDFDGNNDVSVQDPVFRLYSNDKLILEEAAVKNDEEMYLCSGWTVMCHAGDRIKLCFCCRDQFGLCYEFDMGNYLISEGEKGRLVSEETGEVEWVRLIWE